MSRVSAVTLKPLSQDKEVSRGDILHPEVVKKFKRLNLAARFIVRGFFQGLNPSMLKGCSVDFVDLREYSPGDDLRLLDWKAYARTDRFFVRQFEVERDAGILLLLDASPSMSFTSSSLSKFEYARYLIAALAFIGSHEHDRVGLFVSDGENNLPPRRGRAHLHRLLHLLGGSALSRDTAPFTAFQSRVAKLKRRGSIVVVSDLLGDEAEISLFLRRAAFGGHSIILFHVLDRAERELTFDGDIDFCDLETPWRRLVHVNDGVRRRYREELARYCESVRAQCARLGIVYAFIDTGTPFDSALVTYLLRRRRLRRSSRGGGKAGWMRHR